MKEYKILIVDAGELEFLLQVFDMAADAGAIDKQQALDWIHNACSVERQEILRDLPVPIRE